MWLLSIQPGYTMCFTLIFASVINPHCSALDHIHSTLVESNPQLSLESQLLSHYGQVRNTIYYCDPEEQKKMI